MSRRQRYTDEELGIDPARERRIIRLVIGTMVFLLIAGLLFMLVLLTVESVRREDPAPEQPFMEFSRPAVYPPTAAPFHRAA